MRRMLAPEIQTFLAQGTRTAKVATVRADGHPHVARVTWARDRRRRSERAMAFPANCWCEFARCE